MLSVNYFWWFESIYSCFSCVGLIDLLRSKRATINKENKEICKWIYTTALNSTTCYTAYESNTNSNSEWQYVCINKWERVNKKPVDQRSLLQIIVAHQKWIFFCNFPALFDPVPTDNTCNRRAWSSLVNVMAWHRPGHRPLSEPCWVLIIWPIGDIVQWNLN